MFKALFLGFMCGFVGGLIAGWPGSIIALLIGVALGFDKRKVED